MLLDVDGRELIGLNEVGARVWELADGTRTVGEIAAILERKFEVDLDEAAADVSRFVDVLASHGAITNHPSWVRTPRESKMHAAERSRRRALAA